MNRRVKQLTYGGFYLFLFLLLFSFLYFTFFKPGPSCSDGIQNQAEEGIDCGGPCSKVCFPENFSDLEVTQTKIFKIGLNQISLFAEVKNSNTSLAVDSFDYVFNLYDDNDNLIQAFSGNSFVYSADTSYVLIPGLNVTSSLAKRGELIVKSPDWVKKDTLIKPKLKINDVSTFIDDGRIKISGAITNEDVMKFSKVKIIGIILGRFNKPIGASLTELNNLESNQTLHFEIIHPYLPDVNFSVTKVVAFPDQN